MLELGTWFVCSIALSGDIPVNGVHLWSCRLVIVSFVVVSLREREQEREERCKKESDGERGRRCVRERKRSGREKERGGSEERLREPGEGEGETTPVGGKPRNGKGVGGSRLKEMELIGPVLCGGWNAVVGRGNETG